MIGEIGSQMGTVLSTQGDIYATSEAKKALAAQGNTNPTRQDIEASAAYQSTIKQYGTGSDFQQATQAVTAALQGLAGGDIGKALAGGAAPYLAEVIKKATGENKTANAMAHAVLGAVVAEINGNSALAGAAGAAGGELAAQVLADKLYGKKPSELTEQERQNVSTLGTIVGGLAGGLAGKGSGDVVAGGEAGKNAVENNYLSSSDKSRQTELNHKQNLTPQEQKERDALNRKDAETSKALIDACMGGSAAACTAARKDAQDKQNTYQSQGYQNQKETQEGYQQIQQLLNGTSKEALQTQELFNGMVAAYIRTGMSEESAKSAVGYQLGAMYIVGGVAGIGGGKAADDGLTPSVKPSTKPGGETQLGKENANLEIKQLPDAHGKNHATAVKDDAHVPVDKVELWLRGGAVGDKDALVKQRAELMAEKNANQSAFAKSGKEAELKNINDNITRLNRSQQMGLDLEKAGIPNTQANNSMIMERLLDSAKAVNSNSTSSSIVLQGTNGSVRINAKWKVMEDGTKRLTTMTTGTF